jgi:hypothetical protein
MSIVVAISPALSAIHHGLEAFRITGTVDFNFREGFRDLVKIFRTHFDLGASEIFLQQTVVRFIALKALPEPFVWDSSCIA